MNNFPPFLFCDTNDFMWTKIFLGTLLFGLVPMLFLTFYTNSWLKSIGAPSDAAAGFEYYANISWNFLWISTLILFTLGNILLWKTRKAWALWATFAYFTIFIFVKYFWLDVAFADFKKINRFTDSGIAGSVFAGVFYSLFFAIIVFFNQFIILRLSEKMHPETIEPKEFINEIPSAQPDLLEEKSEE